MKIELNQIKLVCAELKNDGHKKGFWDVKNANLEYNLKSSKTISYEDHSNWWETAFEGEYMYCILYKSGFCGYIRLTKKETKNKEKYEISIALVKKFQRTGIGSYSYSLFEREMIEQGINEIVALTHKENNYGQSFFKKNGFKKTIVKEDFIRYYKKL